MTEKNSNVRLIVRPTTVQYNRIHKILSESGQYKHLSELLRHLLEIGLIELEREKRVIEQNDQNK
jgi:hypothetical protein